MKRIAGGPEDVGGAGDVQRSGKRFMEHGRDRCAVLRPRAGAKARGRDADPGQLLWCVRVGGCVGIGNLPVVDILCVQGGLIAEHWDVADTFNRLRQLGISDRLLESAAAAAASELL